MAEVVVENPPSVFGSIITLLLVFGLAVGALELFRSEGSIKTFVEGLEGKVTSTLPPSNVKEGTGSTTPNQNPGTTSQAATQPSSVAQNVITIMATVYGVYGLLPVIAAFEGKLRESDDYVMPGPCDKVTCDVTLVNDTVNDYDVTLYGYLIPAGQPETPSSAVGHFWPNNAVGITPGQKYNGIYPGKVTAKSRLTTSNVSSGPMQIPNEKFGVLWQVYLTGESSYTSERFDKLRIDTAEHITKTPTCTG